MSIANKLLPLAVAGLSLESVYNRYKVHKIASEANMTALDYYTYISFRYCKVEGEPDSEREKCRAHSMRIVNDQLGWTNRSLFDRIVYEPPVMPPSFMHLKIKERLEQQKP